MEKQILVKDAAGSPTQVRFLVLAGLCIAASIAYVCRQSIGVAESTIRAELGLSERAMGWVMSSFYLAYALGQIPTGWLSERWGSRGTISLFAVLWSAATGAMSFAFGLPLLLTSRIANGLAQAGLFPASTATIGKWFPDTGRAVACGLLGSFMSIGGVIGAAATGVLVERVGWRGMFIGYSLLGVVFSAIFYVWFRNTPAEHTWTNAAERRLVKQKPASSQEKIPGDWLGIYFSPPTWWICGQQFCRAAGQIFFASWFATYLQETRGVSVGESGILNSLPLIGLVVGSMAGGSASDYVLARTGNRWLARSGVASLSMLACAMFVFAAYFVADPFLAVVTISLGTFCAAVGGPCAYAVTIDMGDRHTAILFGTMNMIGNLGAFAFISIVPEIIELLNWDAVLSLFGVLYLGACCFWLLLNPNGTVLDHSLWRKRPE